MDSVIKSLRDRMTSENSVQIADGDYVRVPAGEIRYALQRIAALKLEFEAVHEQKSGELLEDKAFRHEWERGQKARAELAKVAAERDRLAGMIQRAHGEMVGVNKEDANNYCLILRLLGMEDEGDPVAEIERLQNERDECSKNLDYAVKSFEMLAEKYRVVTAERDALRVVLQKIADASLGQYPAGGIKQALPDIACAAIFNTAPKDGGAA